MQDYQNITCVFININELFNIKSISLILETLNNKPIVRRVIRICESLGFEGILVIVSLTYITRCVIGYVARRE